MVTPTRPSPAAEPGARFFVHANKEFVGTVLYLRHQAGKVKQVCKDGREHTADKGMDLRYMLSLVKSGDWKEISLTEVHQLRIAHNLSVPGRLLLNDRPATIADAW